MSRKIRDKQLRSEANLLISSRTAVGPEWTLTSVVKFGLFSYESGQNLWCTFDVEARRNPRSRGILFLNNARSTPYFWVKWPEQPSYNSIAKTFRKNAVHKHCAFFVNEHRHIINKKWTYIHPNLVRSKHCTTNLQGSLFFVINFHKLWIQNLC